jgi:hypothetical protein
MDKVVLTYFKDIALLLMDWTALIKHFQFNKGLIVGPMMEIDAQETDFLKLIS